MRTPTSATGSDDRRGEAGFSLIEMLAVLVVLTLAMGTATLSFSRRTDRMSVSALAAETASRARAARDLAIRTGQDTLLRVDLRNRTIAVSGGTRVLAITGDIELEVVSSGSERTAVDVAGVRFFPYGASTGATIRLGQLGSSHEIRINWFTGRVVVVPPS